MDNWNHNYQNEYTGITAQRRNRRRTGTGSVQPEPVKAEPDLSAWRRPVPVAEPEEPVKPEVPEEPETPAEPEIPVTPEITAGPETPEPAAEASPAAEDADTVPEPETSSEPEQPAEPDLPAEEPYVVQGTDSRVPPEARRMAAAPYGTAGAARRTGTRTHSAQSRVSVPGEKREPDRPWRERTADRMSPRNRRCLPIRRRYLRD